MMAHDWHPTDEQLFDLVEGTLARADRKRVREHVDACEQCSGLVQAASALKTAPTAAIESLPEERAVAMHKALAIEWDHRNLSRAKRTGFSAVPRWRRIANIGVAMAVVAGVVGITTFGGGGGGSDSAQKETPASGEESLAGRDQATDASGGAAAPQEGAPADAPGEATSLEEQLDGSDAPHDTTTSRSTGNEITTMKSCTLFLRGEPTRSVLPNEAGTVTRAPRDPFGAIYEVCVTTKTGY